MNRSDIDRFYDNHLHVPSRTLMLSGPVDQELAETAILGLHILGSINHAPIHIILNTEGGEEQQGMAIYDAIKASHSEITVTGVGSVMSMGSVIIQAADIRKMSPNAMFMFHYGQWGIEDHPKIARAWMKAEEKFSKKMEDIYLDKIHEIHPRFTRNKIQKMLDFDTILTAEEAMDLGLIDEIST